MGGFIRSLRLRGAEGGAGLHCFLFDYGTRNEFVIVLIRNRFYFCFALIILLFVFVPCPSQKVLRALLVSRFVTVTIFNKP
jgi:hypothetical protein